MQKLKFLSLVIVLGFFSIILPTKLLAQTVDASQDSSIAAELSADEINADDLDISEDDIKLPGTFGHWWSNFKINTQSAFSGDDIKKAEFKLKQANLELLAVKKLANIANTDKTKERLNKALENYQDRLAKLEERLKNIPQDKKQAILEKIDEQQLKHQELFNKLKDTAPDKIKERLAEVQKEQIKKWYENHKEDIAERLRKAVEDNDDGSKFKNLQNLTTLKEISANLPEEAQAPIQKVITATQARLQERLQNLKIEEQEKLEKYLKSLPTDEIKKTEIINNLQTDNGFDNLQARLEKVKAEQLEKIKNQLDNMDDSAKEEFLREHFNNQADATRLQILEKIKKDIPSMKIRVQELDEKQLQLLKTKIQNTNNQEDLEKLKKELEKANRPILHKELFEQSIKIKPDDRGVEIEIEGESNDNSRENSERKSENERRGKDIPQVRPLNSSSAN